MSETTNERHVSRLTELDIPTPDKKMRAYDADYVDGLLEQAQRAIDARDANLAEAGSYIETLERQVEENAKATPDATPSAHNVAEQASELLSRAAVLAEDHVREARVKADALVAEAQAKVDHATRDAEEARRTLLEQIEHLNQVRGSAIQDIEGLLNGHLSSLHAYVRKTNDVTAPSRPSEPVQRPSEPVQENRPVESQPTAQPGDFEDEDPLQEL